MDARPLDPGTTYYYQFFANGWFSPVGRTKTMPVGEVEYGRFAVVSCANLPEGFFNAYGAIARRDDLDLVQEKLQSKNVLTDHLLKQRIAKEFRQIR